MNEAIQSVIDLAPPLVILFMLFGLLAVLSMLMSSKQEKPEYDDPLVDLFTGSKPKEVEEWPEVHRLSRVNTHKDGEDIFSPKVWMLMDDRGVAWDYVAECLDSLHDEFSEFHIRQYEFHCMSEEFDGSYCFKLTIGPRQMEQFANGELTTDELKALIIESDTGDDGIPPVDWMECHDHRDPSDVSGASGGAAATAAGAGAACGGAAGAGGAC